MRWPMATLQHASSVALRSGATSSAAGSLTRIHRARPDVPSSWPTSTRRSVDDGSRPRLAEVGERPHPADLTIDEGAGRGGRAAALALVYLVAPTTPAPDSDASSGGYYAVSRRVTGVRVHAAGRRCLLRDVRQPVPSRCRLRRLAAVHVRQLGRVVDGVMSVVPCRRARGWGDAPDGRPRQNWRSHRHDRSLTSAGGHDSAWHLSPGSRPSRRETACPWLLGF